MNLVKMENTETAGQHMHFRIVEQGKIHALEGNHSEALRHYREGIRMCETEIGADFFFQHYGQCAMESLELMGAHQEVISFCEKTLAFLDDKKEQSDYLKKYYANIAERAAIQFLFLEDKAEAIHHFNEVKQLIGLKKQPLTAQLLTWAQRGYTITKKQLTDTQKRFGYFIVRKENIKPEIAVQLPEMAMPL